MNSKSIASLYDAYYFEHGCGLPYHRDEQHWAQFFGRIAERIVGDIQPAHVLDAGCAMGFLVEAFRQRDVEAYGIDISEYAIANACPAIQPFCKVRSILDPLPRAYDLIVCIEVLEHLQPQEAPVAIANLCQHSDDILFSSTPNDFKEATHFNVRPAEYWAEEFARHGFYRDIDYDAGFICPWALRFRKCRQPLIRTIAAYERRLQHLEKEIQGTRGVALEQRAMLAENETTLTDMRGQLQERDQLQQAKSELEAQIGVKDLFIQRLLEDKERILSALKTEQQSAQEELSAVLRAEMESFENGLRAEKEKVERALRAERNEVERKLLAEKRDLEARLRADLERQERKLRSEKEQLEATLRAAMVRQEETLGNEKARLEQTLAEERAGNQQLLQSLSETKERAVQTLSQELSRKEQFFLAQITDKDRALQHLRMEMENIRRSRSWRVAQRIRALRYGAFPAGTWRERVARLGYRGLRVWKHEGSKAVVGKACRMVARKVKHLLSRPVSPGVNPTAPPPPTAPMPVIPPAYEQWIALNEPNQLELERQRHTPFAVRPKISIVVPTFNTPTAFLVPMIESVLNQTYTNWELCIADASAADHSARKTLQFYSQKDERIKVKLLPRNLGIAGNSNEGLALATGDWIALLDHDDTLALFALFEVVHVVNQHPEVDFIYSDEDKINETGDKRTEPHFKPDWALDNLRSHNYICHLSVFRHDVMARVGGFLPGYDGSQDYDLILRTTEQAKQIVHIPKILYHWRMHSGSAASVIDAKMYAYDSARKALAEHLFRLKTPGEVQDGVTLGLYQIRYHLTRQPLVSVIIPNRDQAKMLRRCLRSLQAAHYAPYEIVIAENHSREPETFALYDQLRKRPNIKVVQWADVFNYAAVNNFAVNHAQGEVLLFLNNDIEAINPDWLERMLEHALRPEVGAVGAKLIYPDETIQHGGIVLGLGGVAGHVHHWCPRESFGYQGRLVITQNFSAVTAACLMTRRQVFDEVGGFDERFAVTFNDVDLCVKIRRKGHLIVWTPYAELYHYESRTRGADDSPEKRARFEAEVETFKDKWLELLRAGDPYFSPNFTLQRPDFSLKIGPGPISDSPVFLSLPAPAKAA